MVVKVRSIKQAMETPLQHPREVRRLDEQQPPRSHEGGMLLEQPWPIDKSLQKAKRTDEVVLPGRRPLHKVALSEIAGADLHRVKRFRHPLDRRRGVDPVHDIAEPAKHGEMPRLSTADLEALLFICNDRHRCFNPAANRIARVGDRRLSMLVGLIERSVLHRCRRPSQNQTAPNSNMVFLEGYDFRLQSVACMRLPRVIPLLRESIGRTYTGHT